MKSGIEIPETQHCKRVQDIAAAIRQGLRVYSIMLGSLIILTETEWDRFLSLFRALDGWIIRGLLQLFEAGLTLELARASGATDFHRSTQVTDPEALTIHHDALCNFTICSAEQG